MLKWMDDNLNWTAQVGQAFLNQQPDVMASIQRLRAEASKLGNLQSSPQQQVITDGSDIEIVPADPQVIYVPVYQPDQVSLLSNQRTALNLQMEQLTASAQLIKALGGGWDVSQGTTAAIP